MYKILIYISLVRCSPMSAYCGPGIRKTLKVFLFGARKTVIGQ